MKKQRILAGLLALTMTATHAGTTADLESSAIVKGTIVLAKDGSVQSAVLEDEAKMGAPIAELVRKAAMQWRFEPVKVDGEPVVAKSSMNVRLVAKKLENGDFTVRIKGATFGGEAGAIAADRVQSDEGNKKLLPRYPDSALRARLAGTVYMALRIDRTGHVTDAVAEQVNLNSTGPDRVLKQWRDVFSESALKVARQWTYRVPTEGKLAQRNDWTIRVPIVYALTKSGEFSADGIWLTYLPGPYTPAPWVDKPDASAADAMADGGVFTDGTGLVPLTPISQG